MSGTPTFEKRALIMEFGEIKMNKNKNKNNQMS